MLKWTSCAYALQEDTSLNEYEEPLILKSCERVCDAVYLNPVPKAKHWYTMSTICIKVRLQHILLRDIELIPETEDNPLPKNISKNAKTQCRKLMAKRISDNELDLIHEDIYRRETVDYTEDINDVSYVNK